MSTSLLYHGFKIYGYKYINTKYGDGRITFHVQAKPELYCCSNCGSREIIKHGIALRTFRLIPIGSESVFLEAAIPRVECRKCGVIRQVKIGFADARHSYTHSFERYALDLSRRTTIQDVARHLGISWDVIKDIQSRYLKRRFSKPRLKKLRLIAIDEIAVAKGHRYLTIVLDLETGAVIFVGSGKEAASLEPFWARLLRSGAKIEAVAMDMSKAYISAVSEHLPGAQIVFDRFHIVKLYNDRLSEFRSDLYREAEDVLKKQVLKGTKWLLLKNPENLDGKRKERERLDEALSLNRSLAVAYYMKEDLRQIWERKDKSSAEKFLEDWAARASASGIQFLQKLAKTLLGYRSGVLAWYDYPISTGPLEGVNNKINTMKRQSYGFRDMAFFKLKILGLHETKYALVG